METILIATDFSPAARTATLYGFELAKAMNAKVILYTSYQAPAAQPDQTFYITPDDNERMHFKKLLDEAETLDPHKRVALITECQCGPVTDTLLSVAAAKNVSYIVVGMKGRGKEVRKLFGSTVTELCKRSTIPVIVIPQNSTFAMLNKIVLASDINDEREIHILEPLKRLVNYFGATVNIVRVITNTMDEVVERVTRSEGLNTFFTGLNFSYEFEKNDNVAKAINNFSEKNGVNMVTVIPHEHTFMERLFTRSVTKDLVFHTHIPLLILPSNNTFAKKETTGKVFQEGLPNNTLSKKDQEVGIPSLQF